MIPRQIQLHFRGNNGPTAAEFSVPFPAGNSSAPFAQVLTAQETVSPVGSDSPGGTDHASRVAFYASQNTQARERYAALPTIVQWMFPLAERAVRPSALVNIDRAMGKHTILSQPDILSQLNDLEQNATVWNRERVKYPLCHPVAMPYYNLVKEILSEKDPSRMITSDLVVEILPFIKQMGLNGNDLAIGLTQFNRVVGPEVRNNQGKFKPTLKDVSNGSGQESSKHQLKNASNASPFQGYEKALLQACLMMGPHAADILSGSAEKSTNQLYKLGRMVRDIPLMASMREAYHLIPVGSEQVRSELVNLLQIAYTYHEAGQTEAFQAIIQKTAGVDGKQLRKVALQGIAQSVGMLPDQVEYLPDEAFSQWNFRHVYKIPEARKILSQQPAQLAVFDQLVRKTFTGDFRASLHDPSETYGRANCETRDQFYRNGLNYDVWLHFDGSVPGRYENGKPFEMKLWERDPSQDLFLGNYAQSCIALGGNNVRGILDSLTHTAIQLAEIRDPKTREVSGYARFFWANAYGEMEPKLILDNIFIKNDTKLTVPDKERLMQTAGQFMSQYAQAVTGRRVPVYANSNCRLFDLDEPQPLKKSFELSLLGRTTDGTFQLNSIAEGFWSRVDSPFQASLVPLSGAPL